MDNLINYDRVSIPDKHRIKNEEVLQFFRERDENGVFDLTEDERCWVEDYDYLLSHGYQLRPRFHPHWSPSWRGTDVPAVACEDSVQHFSASVIDAKRLEDGKIVAIKRVPPITFETEIATMLSSECPQDHMNHCVPIFDHFPDNRSNNKGSFIAMPLLRSFDDPPFAYVDEVADFVRQTLEGLVFIHKNNIAHRDLSDGNIMMEGRALYEEDGFHPSDQEMTARDILVRCKPRARKEVGFVKYYFIDFGLSVHFDDPSQLRLVTGNRAQEATVPELSDRIPYDPFAVDVFTLGMVFRRNFLDKYSNVKFLAPLCSSMTELLPKRRPNAVDALTIFQESQFECRGMVLRWRLRPRSESYLQMTLGELRSAFRELEYQVKPPAAFCLSIVNVLSFLLCYGPRRLIGYLRRPVEDPESRPLLRHVC